MKIKVLRDIFTANTTMSKMFINDQFICYGLEDKCRSKDEQKVYGATAIPYGIYQVTLRQDGDLWRTMCKRFTCIGQERGMLHIHNLPNTVYPLWYDKQGVLSDNFVLIHTGNTAADTLGCLLVGDKRDKDCILSGTSTPAYSKLYPIVADAIMHGEQVTIEYCTA